jgi:hypothetical protein
MKSSQPTPPNPRHPRASSKPGALHRSKLIHIGIGRAHAGTRVLLMVADQHIRVITDSGELLRELTIDANRNNQPGRT